MQFQDVSGNNIMLMFDNPDDTNFTLNYKSITGSDISFDGTYQEIVVHSFETILSNQRIFYISIACIELCCALILILRHFVNAMQKLGGK